jgi:hypothetical protein
MRRRAVCERASQGEMQMGAIASIIYGVMFDRAFLGATYFAIAPLFRKPVRRPNRFGFLLAECAIWSLRAGCPSLAIVGTVCILSCLDQHGPVAVFGHQHDRDRQQTSHPAARAEGPSVDRRIAMRQANLNLAGHAQTTRRPALED